jgi:hypothetical protein
MDSLTISSSLFQSEQEQEHDPAEEEGTDDKEGRARLKEGGKDGEESEGKGLVSSPQTFESESDSHPHSIHNKNSSSSSSSQSQSQSRHSQPSSSAATTKNDKIKPSLASGSRASSRHGQNQNRNQLKMQDSFIILSKSHVTASQQQQQHQYPSSLNNPSTTTSQQQPFPPIPNISLNTMQPRSSLSHRLKIAQQLFDLISGVDTDSDSSKIDHPLCQECADELLVRLEKRVGELRRDRDTYSSFLDSLNNASSPDSKSAEQLDKELAEALVWIISAH